MARSFPRIFFGRRSLPRPDNEFNCLKDFSSLNESWIYSTCPPIRTAHLLLSS